MKNDRKIGMSKQFLLALSLLLGMFSVDVPAASSTVQTGGFWWGLIYRQYDFYIPAGLAADRPLLVMMHGHSGDRKQFYNDSWTHAFADEKNIAMMWPEGDIPFPLNSWNAGPCCGVAAVLNHDDVSYLDRAIGEVKGRARTDDTRVYMAGISNGAIMSHRYALERKGVTAIYPMSFPATDNIWWHMPQAWKEGRKTPVRAVHSKDDALLYYNGGVALPHLSLPFGLLGSSSAQDGLKLSASINACGPQSSETLLQDIYGRKLNGQDVAPTYAYVTDFVLQSYNECDMETSVHLISLPLGNHGGALMESGENSAAGWKFKWKEDAWTFMSNYIKPGHKADRMWHDQELQKSQYLISPNKQFQLYFHSNGNLALYDNADRVLWQSNTGGRGADRLVMQNDGNLAIYKPGYWVSGPWWCFGLCNTWVAPSKVWATNTAGPGSARVQIRDDGRFMVLRDGREVWRN